MREATGEFIAFLDSDDEWLEGKLETQLAILEERNSEWGCIYGGVNVFKDGSTKAITLRRPLEGWLVREYILGQFIIETPTFLFRRKCLDTVGFMDETLRRSQDVDFFIRMLYHFKLAKVDRPVANVFMDTKKPLAAVALESKIQLLEKHEGLMNELGPLTKRRVYARQWIVQAENFFATGHTVSGAKYMAKAIACFPFLPPKRYLAATYKLMKSPFIRRST